jgi:Glycosyltransferase family 87
VASRHQPHGWAGIFRGVWGPYSHPKDETPATITQSCGEGSPAWYDWGMGTVLRHRRTRIASLVTLLTVLGVAASHVVGRFHYDEVVYAVNGRFTPFDLDVFLRAGDHVLAGQSPYPNPETFAGESNYVYPPVLALLMMPFSALPEHDAVTLYMLLSIAAIIVAIRLLGVRDWRCYVLALFFPVVHESLRHGTVGSFLILLLALLWRYRDRTVVAGTAVAFAVVLKLFLWPFVLWLALTRRVRGAAVAVTAGVGLAVASWAAIGFAGLADYPRLLGLLVDKEADSSFSVVAVGNRLGLPPRGADLLALAAGTSLLWLAARTVQSRGRSRFEQDRMSLTLVLAASLALTPILWLHYLSLLVVPIALARPRLSPLWFTPFALLPMFWLNEYNGWPNGDIDALTAAIGLAIAVFASALAVRRTPHPAGKGRSTRRPLV